MLGRALGINLGHRSTGDDEMARSVVEANDGVDQFGNLGELRVPDELEISTPGRENDATAIKPATAETRFPELSSGLSSTELIAAKSRNDLGVIACPISIRPVTDAKSSPAPYWRGRRRMVYWAPNPGSTR